MFYCICKMVSNENQFKIIKTNSIQKCDMLEKKVKT